MDDTRARGNRNRRIEGRAATRHCPLRIHRHKDKCLPASPSWQHYARWPAWRVNFPFSAAVTKTLLSVTQIFGQVGPRRRASRGGARRARRGGAQVSTGPAWRIWWAEGGGGPEYRAGHGRARGGTRRRSEVTLLKVTPGVPVTAAAGVTIEYSCLLPRG